MVLFGLLNQAIGDSMSEERELPLDPAIKGLIDGALEGESPQDEDSQ